MSHPFRSTLTTPVHFKTILAAYAAILIGIPALSALNMIAFQWSTILLAPSPQFYTAIKPVLDPIAFFYTALALSPLFSWIGALMSAPAVWLALRYNAFGWATAALTGIITFQINWSLYIQDQLGWSAKDPYSVEWIVGTLGATILGLTFWLTTLTLARRQNLALERSAQ